MLRLGTTAPLICLAPLMKVFCDKALIFGNGGFKPLAGGLEVGFALIIRLSHHTARQDECRYFHGWRTAMATPPARMAW